MPPRWASGTGGDILRILQLIKLTIANRGNMDKNTFSDFRSKINSYLDHEMSPEDQNNFLQQIKAMPDVQDELRHERLIRSKLRENLKRPMVAPDLADRIKNKLPR